MPFIAMDCGAISSELAGSELFGHEKGSFTGAITTKIGHFEIIKEAVVSVCSQSYAVWPAGLERPGLNSIPGSWP